MAVKILEEPVVTKFNQHYFSTTRNDPRNIIEVFAELSKFNSND